MAARAGLGGGARHDEHRLRAVDVVDDLLHAVHDPTLAVGLGSALVQEHVVAVVEFVEADRDAFAAQKPRRDLRLLLVIARGPDVERRHERREPVAEPERRVPAEDRPPPVHEVLGGHPATAERRGDELRRRTPLVEERLCSSAHAPRGVVGDDRRVVERAGHSRIAEQRVEVRRGHAASSHPSMTEILRPPDAASSARPASAAADATAVIGPAQAEPHGEAFEHGEKPRLGCRTPPFGPRKLDGDHA